MTEDKSKIPCTACILTLNSGKTLERCLSGLVEFDEIVVMDGNSTDNTLEIAGKYGAAIYPQTETKEKNVKITNFIEVRNRLFSLPKNDWVFAVDSDEYVTPELVTAIRGIVSRNNILDAALVNRKTVIGDKVIEYAFFYPDMPLRVWNRKGGIYYKSGGGAKKVHEKPFFPDGINKIYLQEAIMSPWEDWESCLRKDNYYLELASGGVKSIPLPKRIKKAINNFLKAVYIALKSGVIYLKFGFRASLPPKYVWRFMRYHFILGKNYLF
ncbi:glycosyltransferase family 2 protein [Candidatus Uhrbacteria bacterium]|nr:glycosyltransferase family 2 protein [Candidatus Uhrbacteria bacterium]